MVLSFATVLGCGNAELESDGGIEAHTFHIHGHSWVDSDGLLTDNIQLSPGTYKTFEFQEDRAGEWLVHCHFPNHMAGGMMTRYDVAP